MTTTTTITQFLTHTHKLSYAQSRHALFSILKKFTQIFFFFFTKGRNAQKTLLTIYRHQQLLYSSTSCTHPPLHLLSTLHFPVKYCNNRQSIILIRNYISLFFNMPKSWQKAQVAFGFLKHFLSQFCKANLFLNNFNANHLFFTKSLVIICTVIMCTKIKCSSIQTILPIR